MFQKKETFRKAALERLASPERLDEMMRITSPKGWIALTTCGLLIAGALVWSVFGRIPERVFAQGILIPGGSLLQVEANTEGMITEFFVEVGDEVEAGQPLAGINLAGRQFDLGLLQDQLTSLQRRDQDLRESEQLRYETEVAGLEERRRSLAIDRETRAVAVRTAQTELERARRLFEQGAVARSRFEQAELGLSQVSSDFESVDTQFAQIESDLSRLQTEILQAQSSREREIEDLEREITRKTRETESTAFVESPFTGRVTEIAVTEGSTVAQRDVILRLERIDEELKALLYVPSKPGKMIEVGHPVHISPSTVKKEEFGSIIATVSAAQTQPATPAGMLKDLGNQRLVDEYSAAGAPLRIEAALSEHIDTSSGYEWTSRDGAPVTIFSGTPCNATIIIGEKRPIDYVIPIFKNLVSG